MRKIESSPAINYCILKQHPETQAGAKKMRTFTTGGTNFYFMNRGEKLTTQQQFKASATYVIWPRHDKWDLRYKCHHGWEEIHGGLFESENEAFLFAYQHFIDDGKSRTTNRYSVPV